MALTVQDMQRHASDPGERYHFLKEGARHVRPYLVLNGQNSSDKAITDSAVKICLSNSAGTGRRSKAKVAEEVGDWCLLYELQLIERAMFYELELGNLDKRYFTRVTQRARSLGGENNRKNLGRRKNDIYTRGVDKRFEGTSAIYGKAAIIFETAANRKAKMKVIRGIYGTVPKRLDTLPEKKLYRGLPEALKDTRTQEEIRNMFFVGAHLKGDHKTDNKNIVQMLTQLDNPEAVSLWVNGLKTLMDYRGMLGHELPIEFARSLVPLSTPQEGDSLREIIKKHDEEAAAKKDKKKGAGLFALVEKTRKRLRMKKKQAEAWAKAEKLFKH